MAIQVTVAMFYTVVKLWVSLLNVNRLARVWAVEKSSDLIRECFMQVNRRDGSNIASF